ncbi:MULTISPECIES: oxidoreductase [Inquilinus]|uniref:NAD(P)-dependent dehydrogenase (Short-subunit alcohol dehydrogenase family) n=1 Tax=Inquilinus ginsengisoli TaxID=363840 RepID=A0ABU1JSZ7_9PROT|nr:oxidoreductase [Inquilinus ginsengisoli]MDR6291742.1 NAD(P)-dependent dehydrogenase (short-subunit alcohol dehydrogenase family) [Inquilinus ginsengisoli]
MPKTWFITGASSGFGRAFADHALAQGDAVVAAVRTVAKLDDLAAQAPDRVLVLPLDVDRPGAAQAAVDAAVARFGGIDVLVNNAGYGIVGAVEETPEAELRAQMETNFFGAAAVIRAALPVLRAQRRGAIVNISSLGGQLSFAGFSAYSASKFALEGLSEALAQELAPFGIKVLIVEPGAFRTGFHGGALRPMPVMAAYAETVGKTRDFARGLHEAQEGDPRKVPAAVERALAAARTPLRLQLGADAVAMVREHAETLLAELKAWEAVALATRVEAIGA